MLDRCWWMVCAALLGCGNGGTSGSSTGNTADEGPWNIKAGGVDIGRAFCTQPVNAVWNEFFERRSTGWGFAHVQTWEVSVGATYSGQPTCSGAAYQACQRTQITMTSMNATKPSEYFTPTAATLAASQDLLEYHAAGTYSIEATWTPTAGSPVTALAYYYVSNGTGNDLRLEKICAPSTFSWPARANPARSAVTWKISWLNSNPPPNNCPGGWKTHTWTIDLDP